MISRSNDSLIVLIMMDITSSDVKDILRDVNYFLTEILQNEKLSNSAVSAKEELLKKISSLPEIATPYLDMTCSTKKSGQSSDYVPLNINECCVESQLYEEFPEQTCYNLPPEENQQECIIEYLILPASKLRVVAKKFGLLCRREKFMGLFVERSIRSWVGILGDILYIYSSDRDTKPASFVNIQGFEARPAVNYYPKDVKKRECCFELVCPGKKSLQFVACSVSDMEQWIVCINEVSSQVNKGNDNVVKKRRLPSPPPSAKTNETLEYDDIRALNCKAIEKCDSSREKIYHNLRSLSIKDESPDSNTSLSVLTKIPSDHELVYDDICGINPNVYYNVSEKIQKEEQTDYNGLSHKGNTFGYSDDEDIYDDIGIISVKSETLVLTNIIDTESINTSSHISKNGDITCVSKMQVFNQSLSESQRSLCGNSIHCNDNLYEPVDNPRDE